MGTWKDCVRGMLANLVQVEGESLERFFKRTRQLCSEGDVYGEDDMRWVVRAFINGLVDDELHRAMRAARRKNRSMTLGQAYEELRDLTSPRDVLNSYHIAGPALAAKAENSVDELSTITLIPVSYMSPDILSDPVAFSQFFISHHARPFYQSSGPFSRQSIQKLHAAYCQPTPAKCGIIAGAANAGPAVTMGEVSASHSTLSNPHRELAQDVCTAALVDDYINSVQNSLGEEKEEKWQENGYGQDVVVQGRDVSTMNLGIERDCFVQDLVNSGKNLDAVETPNMPLAECPVAPTTAGEREHKIGEEILETMGEPASGQLHYTTVSESQFRLRNPCVQQVHTTSEWDPGPDESAYTDPAKEEGEAGFAWTSDGFQVVQWHTAEQDASDPNGIAGNETPHDIMYPVEEFLWLLPFGVQQTYRNSLAKSAAILNTPVEPGCLASQKQTMPAKGTSHSSLALDNKSEAPTARESGESACGQYGRETPDDRKRRATAPNRSGVRNHRDNSDSDISYNMVFGGLPEWTCFCLGRQWQNRMGDIGLWGCVLR